MTYNNTHLNQFIESLNNFNEQQEFGKSPKEFLEKILNNLTNPSIRLMELSGILPNQKLSRSSVFSIVNDENLSICYKIICILSWGDMRYGNAYKFFRNWDEYSPNLEVLLGLFYEENISRLWLYDQLNKMQMKGCGISYIPKFIYFFSNGNAYIMDQWTAKSIELIWENKYRIGIKITNNYLPRDNHSGIYEEFCKRVEYLTKYINDTLGTRLNPSQLEERLFSNGANNGQVRGVWRNYVINNW